MRHKMMRWEWQCMWLVRKEENKHPRLLCVSFFSDDGLRATHFQSHQDTFIHTILDSLTRKKTSVLVVPCEIMALHHSRPPCEATSEWHGNSSEFSFEFEFVLRREMWQVGWLVAFAPFAHSLTDKLHTYTQPQRTHRESFANFSRLKVGFLKLAAFGLHGHHYGHYFFLTWSFSPNQCVIYLPPCDKTHFALEWATRAKKIGALVDQFCQFIWCSSQKQPTLPLALALDWTGIQVQTRK